VFVPTSPAKILIVSDDLAFVFWLGRALDDAGYEAWPARNVENAAALLEELSDFPDLLVLDPETPGANRLIERLSPQRHLPLIATHSPDAPPTDSGPEDATIPKPRLPDPLAALEYLMVIRCFLGCFGLKQ
jgi:CheY-like chemotaxis protein